MNFWFNNFLECGTKWIQEANKIKPELNSDGRKGVDELREGIHIIRDQIKKGDIEGQSSNFKKIGAAGLRNLVKTTSNHCLQKVFRKLAKLDVSVGNILKKVESPTLAGIFVCSVLDYKARRLNNCSK